MIFRRRLKCLIIIFASTLLLFLVCDKKLIKLHHILIHHNIKSVYVISSNKYAIETENNKFIGYLRYETLPNSINKIINILNESEHPRVIIYNTKPVKIDIILDDKITLTSWLDVNNLLYDGYSNGSRNF